MSEFVDHSLTRRSILKFAAAGAALAVAGEPVFGRTAARADEPFSISLAQWSLHRTIRKGDLDAADFPKHAKSEFGVDAVEYVNQFYVNQVKDAKYFPALRKRADDAGVASLLIMCDDEGALGDPSEAARKTAVDNHKKWLEAAKILGCHSIRVNAASAGTFEEQQKLAADGLRRLVELAAKLDLNVIVENHGGLSSNGAWLAGTIKLVDHKRAGTLPDFGNFKLADGADYDRYKGVEEMMPYAKGVSAKSHDFDAAGNETHTDYSKMIKIVLAAGYRGRIGIEYEGKVLSEADGIRATKKLLERVRDEIAKAKK